MSPSQLRRGAHSSLAAELRRVVAGKVHEGESATAPWTRDFGRALSRTPGAVVEATGERDVAAVLRLAARLGVEVTLRGAGHSCHGQTLSDGGILIVASRPGLEAPRLLNGNKAEVSARLSWRQVERALHRERREVPVLADYLDLSVGGTLSVGGYGVDSVACGALTDQVERLRLLLPDGRARWCSAREHGELFRASLAGLGQVGVIEKAVIRTRPRRRWTTLFTYEHSDLAAMVDSFQWLTQGEDPTGASGDQGPEIFKALQARGRCVSTYGVAARGPGEALAATPPDTLDRRPHRRLVIPGYRAWRSLAVSLWLARFGRCRRLWSDYVFELPALRAFVAELAELQRRDAFAGCLESLYFLGIRTPSDRLRAPLEAAAACKGPVAFGVGLYCMVPPDDEPAHLAVRRAFDHCLERCAALGGRPYLYGTHQLDAAAMHEIYGSDYARLQELKREFDPLGILQPDILP